MSKTISRNEIAQLLANDADVAIVEVLPARYYDAEHLPGAININHNEVENKAASLLPDRSQTIVVYCSNSSCGNSAVAQQKLEQLGYRDVRKYVEGKQDWIAAGLATEKNAA